jgi:hypothetical protein
MIGPVNSRDDVADGSELDAAARREGQSENGKVHVDLPRRLAKPTRCQKELRIIREGTVRAALSNISQQASEIDYRHQPCFGVDIMEEAVEICKLRLFLKLGGVAMVTIPGRRIFLGPTSGPKSHPTPKVTTSSARRVPSCPECFQNLKGR